MLPQPRCRCARQPAIGSACGIVVNGMPNGGARPILSTFLARARSRHEQRISLAHSAAAGATRRQTRLQLPRDVAGRRRQAARLQRRYARHRLSRDGTRARARRSAHGGGSVESAPRSAGTADRAAPHAADADLRRSHAADSAAGQDLVLHQVDRRRGGIGGAVHGAAAGRYVVPVVSHAGPADRARPQPRRSDVPMPVEHARHVQRTPDAGDVSLGVRATSFRSAAI